jgi:hypothetical protein
MNYTQQTRTRSHARAIHFPSQKYLFWTLLSLIAFFIIFYAYFVNATVINTANLQKNDDLVIDTRSEISQLEFKLIEENKNFTRDYAYSIGLVEISDPVFVARNSNSGLSLNEQR